MTTFSETKTSAGSISIIIIDIAHSVQKLVLGHDDQNIDNHYRYSTFSDNRYHEQISICTYAHSVQGILKNILVT